MNEVKELQENDKKISKVMDIIKRIYSEKCFPNVKSAFRIGFGNAVFGVWR